MVSEEWQQSMGCAGQFWNELDPTEMLIFDVEEDYGIQHPYCLSTYCKEDDVDIVEH
jgi:hypothetical protein